MGLREYLSEYGTPYRLPEIAGTYGEFKGVVVCGDGHCIWDDLERFGCRSDRKRGGVAKEGWHFLTVNKMVEVFPGDVEHSYSNSASCLQRFLAARRDEYAIEFQKPKHSHSLNAPCDWIWPLGGHGTSGLGATLIAVALGYPKVVICGMPLDDGPHNGQPHWRKTSFASTEAAGGQRTDRNTHWWKAKTLAFDGRVRSMSGRTKDWLGDGSAWA
jgi:hypothetical protein